MTPAHPPSEPLPLEDLPGEGTDRWYRPRTLLVGLVPLLLVAAGYLGAAVWAADRLPSDTTVAGVQVGGMTAQEAATRLGPVAEELAAEPVTVTAGERRVEIDPASAGLALDVPGTLDGLTGFSLDPRRLWAHVGGAAAPDLERDIDEKALTTALDAAAEKLEVPSREGAISVEGGKVALIEPVTGRSLDIPATADAVLAQWPASEPVPAVTVAEEPDVSAEELQRVRTEFADKAVAGPVTVKAGDATFQVSPKALAAAITFEPAADGTITPEISDKALLKAVRAAAVAAGVEKPAKDAVVTIRSGQPTVTPSKNGVALKDSSVVKPVTTALTAKDRTAVVDVAVTKPELTTARAKATLPKGLVSTFTTYYPYVPGRVGNIKLAARALDGTYVPPGGTFSLNALLGERTPARGYREAPVIENGRLTTDYGGGISQVSTTTFNAAFFAGMRFVTYLPHSFYISRYPEGREATVSWPDVDQKWVNTTDGGALVKASATNGKVTVSIYGTKKWDVSAVKGPRRNIVQPKTIRDARPGCVPQSPSPGFDVTVSRVFKQKGSVVRRESLNTHYIPEDDVTCTNPS